MIITAAVTETKGGPFTLQTLELDEPQATEILVRIEAVGVCHSDLSMRDQFLPLPMPMVLGHEGAGVIEAVGANVTSLKPGDRVLLTRNTCGTCVNCVIGQSQVCLELPLRNMSGARLDGSTGLSRNGERVTGQFFGQSSFATYVVANERTATLVPATIPAALAPAFGCGVLTGAGAVLHGLHLEAGAQIAVFGVGAVGLSAIMAARVAGAATIVAIDTNPARLEVAKELGATHTVLATMGEDSAWKVRSISPVGVNYSIDTTGAPPVVGSAVDVLRPGGTCVLLGIGSAGTEVTFDQMQVALMGIQIAGFPSGSCDPNVILPTLFELYRQGRFAVDKLVSYFPFADIDTACHSAESGETIKPVLLVDADATS